MNPCAAMRPAVTGDARPRVTAFAVALLVAAPVLTFAAYTNLGPHGLGLMLYVIAAGYFLVSRSSNPKFYPINASRLKITEFAVLIAICGVLHGLAMPAVVTNCAGRRINAAIVSSKKVELPTDGSVQTDYPESNGPTNND